MDLEIFFFFAPKSLFHCFHCDTRTAEERAELDQVVKLWEYVVLVDPSGFPPRILHSHIDDAVPELETFFFGRSKQVVAVTSRQSITVAEGRALGRRCRGDVLRVDVDVSHPAPWNPPVGLEVELAVACKP